MTIKQKIKKRLSKKTSNGLKAKALKQHCQLEGVCLSITTKNPKRPNSANRAVAKIKLSNGKEVFARIMGIGHNLQEHHYVLVRGGRAKDVPGIKLTTIRGSRDLLPVENRKTSVSKYGVKTKKQ